MVMFVIFASVLVLMLLGVTTAVTMGFASAATFLLAGGDMARLFLVPQRMFAQVSGITLMSIPFFLLMGNLMTEGGVSKSLFCLRTRQPRAPLGRALQRRDCRLHRDGRDVRLRRRVRRRDRHDCRCGNEKVRLRGSLFLCNDCGRRRIGAHHSPEHHIDSLRRAHADERQRPFCRGRRARAHHRVCLHAVVLVRLPA